MGDTVENSQDEVSAIKEMLVAFDGLEDGEFVCQIWLCSKNEFSLPPQVHVHTEPGRGSADRGTANAAKKLHASGWRSGMSMFEALQRFPPQG